MNLRRLGNSNLQIAPLALGGNVFGWTIDEAMSFRVLDAFVAAGMNLIDTAEVYSSWHPGNRGGESEAIIGKWLKRSGKRDRVLIATKVGYEMGPDKKGLSKARIFDAIEGSLKRLQVDAIDLYQSHVDDPETPVAETLEVYAQLIKQGKVRAIGASQISPARLKESMETSRARGLPSYVSLQPLYNLYDRQGFEADYAPVCREYDLGVINYYSLGAGFLSGKYRVESDLSKSPRGARAVKERYFNEKGHRIIRALDQVAERLNAPLPSIAVAWVLANPDITAPIASATSPQQLEALVRATELKLDAESMGILEEASSY